MNNTHPIKKGRVTVLTSGGVESSALLVKYSRKFQSVYPLYVKTGISWENSEIYWLKKLLRKLRSRSIRPLTILELSMEDLYWHHWSVTGKGVPGSDTDDSAVYLPGRNIILLSKAALFCAMNEIPTIVLGPLSATPFPDSAIRFFKKMQSALSEGLKFPIDIETPYLKLKKIEVLRKVSQAPWHLTFSCIQPKKHLHCGQCNKCAERKRAFKEAGVIDKTKYWV